MGLPEYPPQHAARLQGAVVVGYGIYAPLGDSWAFIRLFIAWMIWKDGYREYQLALQEEDFRRWTQDDFNARVSPPPYDR